MKRQGISKAELAERMHANRAQLDSVLAKSNVTVETLQRVAAPVGRLELV